MASTTTFTGMVYLFDIQQTGLVGEVDYVFILIQLTSGVVMLGNSDHGGELHSLRFALGNESEIYRGVIQEEYEVGREAARYAAQACVATKSFKDADAGWEGRLRLRRTAGPHKGILLQELFG